MYNHWDLYESLDIGMDRNNNIYVSEANDHYYNHHHHHHQHHHDDRVLTDSDEDYDGDGASAGGEMRRSKRGIFSRSTILLAVFCLCMFMQVTFGESVEERRFGASFADLGLEPGRVSSYPVHHQRRLQRDSSLKDCRNVEAYFETKQVQIRKQHEEKGAICGGNCCTNATEIELRQKATLGFEDSLHHHTESLRKTLKTTAELFENHILEISKQSRNNSLRIFSTVFIVPISKDLINSLYGDIINHLTIKNFGKYEKIELERSINQFFVDLFPVAYHKHISQNNSGELHEDYINCVKHAYDDLKPFDDIPKEIKHNLIQSIHTANIFMNSLLQSAEVLGEVDQLYGLYLSETCKDHLLKMHYCPNCHGYTRKEVKPCQNYCMNVLRGCSAQLVGVLDGPWSNVADAIANLDQHIQSETGIVNVINKLSAKLSDTILNAMTKGDNLEMKINKKCGTPKLLPSRKIELDSRPMAQSNSKLIPLDAGVLNYLSTIHKSKEFYSNIVTASCESDRSELRDKDCWTGDRIGEYKQLVMNTRLDTQRYNPEVPLDPSAQSIKLNEMADKLLKIKNNIGSALPTQSKHHFSDIQSDMARHDEEGSGRMPDDVDDEEYGSIRGSGDGSGDGPTPSSDFPQNTTPIIQRELDTPGSSAGVTKPMCLSAFVSILLLVTLKFSLE